MCDLFNLQGERKMDILNITVGGFRNIKKIKFSFENVTAMVGLNGYGKSNVMDAIDFGFDYIHFASSMREGMMSAKHCIPILRSNAGENYVFDIEIRLDSNGKEYFANYGYSFSWNTDKNPSKIVEEHLYIRKNEKGQKYNAIILRDDKNAKYRSSETGRCSKNIKIEHSNLILSKLLAFDDWCYFDIINQINSIQYYIEKHLDASPSFTPAPFVIKGFQELELQGIQSIPRAIFYLKKDYQDKYELLVNAFKQLFPEVKDVEVEEFKLNQNSKMKISEDAPFMYTDSVYSLSIIDDKMIQPVNFENLSDGTKRVFLTLTFSVIADIKNLSMIAIEEPENSLHPMLLQNYLDILSQLVRNCKIFITSHSPYVLQYLNPRSIYVGLPKPSGEATFERFASAKVNTLLRDAAEYDKSVGDYIFNLLSNADGEEFIREYLENHE